MSCCGAMAMMPPDARPWSAPRAVPGRALDISGMASIPGGFFLMGSDSPDTFIDDAEGPVREVHLPPYLIDTAAVTNAQFAAFVADTGYVTDAERVGWSFVFLGRLHPAACMAVREGVVGEAPWWLAVERAFWRAPEGPGSAIGTRSNHPVQRALLENLIRALPEQRHAALRTQLELSTGHCRTTTSFRKTSRWHAFPTRRDSPERLPQRVAPVVDG